MVEEANSKYRCDFDGCGFVARSKAGLKAHKRKHKEVNIETVYVTQDEAIAMHEKHNGSRT
jgi:sulfatase maturation enzyme AslB (radical SAM superfamily)